MQAMLRVFKRATNTFWISIRSRRCEKREGDTESSVSVSHDVYPGAWCISCRGRFIRPYEWCHVCWCTQSVEGLLYCTGNLKQMTLQWIFHLLGRILANIYQYLQMDPGPDTKLLDVAGGTGDIAFRFMNKVCFVANSTRFWTLTFL